MNRSLATLDGNKYVCTGTRFIADEAPDLAPKRPSEDAFIRLVSEYYKFFRETHADDIAFLLSIERRAAVTEFNNAVYSLRTAKQHNDNSQATKFYDAFASRHDSWQAASNTLAELLDRALTELADISLHVRRDPSLTRLWKERASLEPQSIFEAVCRDFNTVYTGATQQALLSNVKRRAKRLRPHEDVRARLEDFCAQEITAQGRSLPVPYYEVLDRLGVLGTPRARPAALLAYSVSATTKLKGESFLARVEQTWIVANS